MFQELQTVYQVFVLILQLISLTIEFLKQFYQIFVLVLHFDTFVLGCLALLIYNIYKIFLR